MSCCDFSPLAYEKARHLLFGTLLVLGCEVQIKKVRISERDQVV
jgi:hypothetical protein